MKCPHCFAVNPDTCVFCNQCGQRMIDPFEPSATENERTAAPVEETPVDPWAAPTDASFASPSHTEATLPEADKPQDPWALPSAASFASPFAPATNTPDDADAEQPWDAPDAHRSEEIPPSSIVNTPDDEAWSRPTDSYTPPVSDSTSDPTSDPTSSSPWSAPTDASLAGTPEVLSSTNAEPFPDLMTFDDEPGGGFDAEPDADKIPRTIRNISRQSLHRGNRRGLSSLPDRTDPRHRPPTGPRPRRFKKLSEISAAK